MDGVSSGVMAALAEEKRMKEAYRKLAERQKRAAELSQPNPEYEARQKAKREEAERIQAMTEESNAKARETLGKLAEQKNKAEAAARAAIMGRGGGR